MCQEAARGAPFRRIYGCGFSCRAWATISLMASDSGVSSCARPAMTPSRSACVRFWLTFHLPSSRVMAISKPTMPFSCEAIKSGGASATFQGFGIPASCWSVSEVTWASNHAES